jgi:hypothetical protein
MTGYRTTQVVILRKWTYLIISTILFLFHLTHSAQAQFHGQGTGQPHFVTFQSILRFAENENFEKISKSVPFLGNISAEIKDRFGVNVLSEIEIALSERNKANILSTVRKFVFYDMKNFFFLAEQKSTKSPDQSQSYVLAAHLDYLLLAPTVKGKNFQTHQQIQSMFKQLVSMLRVDTSPFSRQKGTLEKEALLRITEKIEAECLRVFPDFVQPP